MLVRKASASNMGLHCFLGLSGKQLVFEILEHLLYCRFLSWQCQDIFFTKSQNRLTNEKMVLIHIHVCM